VLDKPAGPTSHDAVMRVRKALRTREVGHGGTLDPMATGVLVVAVGEATKLLAWLADQVKAHDATVALGVETDTLDAMGQETRRASLSASLIEALDASRVDEVHPHVAAAIQAERARTTQIPPAYSAIQTNGVRAYARARRGELVQLPARDVSVRALAVTGCSTDPPSVSIRVEAEKGYYVRALARDLAADLGTVGHLTALRRTRSGCFTLADATPLDSPPAQLAAHVEPLGSVAARAFSVAHLTDAGTEDARHGRAVRASDIRSAVNGTTAWFAPEGTLVAIGEIDEAGIGRVKRGFVR